MPAVRTRGASTRVYAQNPMKNIAAGLAAAGNDLYLFLCSDSLKKIVLSICV